MYKLTQRRLSVGRAVVEKYREQLYEKGFLNNSWLEMELRKLWDIGYQELKDIFEDMLEKFPRYKYVAAYYMQYSSQCVVSEFQPILARLYGLRHYHASDSSAAKERFWKSFEAKRQNLLNS